MQRLSEIVKVRLTRETFIKVKKEAEKQDTTASELTRDIIENFFKTENAKDSIPEIEDAFRRVLQPYIDRLAGLTVHAGIAAGTSAWLNRAVLKMVANQDVDTIDAWNQAVAKSKANLKRGKMLEETTEKD
ncbi:MAG: hypothetical protein APF76_04745 [Desulfitibacter sp. BRH_c19]|nr:MAG: hypothetical protein APF76_04745 [Desulfitibacter sp. BRH_c19]